MTPFMALLTFPLRGLSIRKNRNDKVIDEVNKNWKLGSHVSRGKSGPLYGTIDFPLKKTVNKKVNNAGPPWGKVIGTVVRGKCQHFRVDSPL